MKSKGYTEEEQRLRNHLQAILYRCNNPNSRAYKSYGAKGIKVCDLWVNKPHKFVEWAIKNNLQKGFHVSRKNHSKNYSPANCVVRTPEEHSWRDSGHIKPWNRRLTPLRIKKVKGKYVKTMCKAITLTAQALQQLAEIHQVTGASDSETIRRAIADAHSRIVKKEGK